MPTPFKVEVFDRDIVYKSHTVINDTPFADDYLTLKKTMLEIPKIDVDRGDYVHVTDFSSNKKYQGIVDDVEKNKYTCMLTLKPLRSILDASVTFDRTFLATGTLEGFISAIITAQFISNADTSQNITGLGVSTTSSTSGAVLDLDSNIGQLYNIITSALSAYGIVVDVELKPQDQEIDVSIGTASATVVKVEADLDNCIDKKFVIGDSFGAVNKLVLINQDNESETATYYLHTDGSVSASNSDRVTPVICKYDYLPSKDFTDKALARATQLLTPQEYDNLIELTYSMNDRIVNIANMAIGTVVSIDAEGETYKSILTGFEKSEDVAKLVFGIVRISQADRQFIKSRSGSGAVYATAEQGAVMDSAFPSSAVDENIVVFDGTTGKKIKDSGAKYQKTYIFTGRDSWDGTNAIKDTNLKASDLQGKAFSVAVSINTNPAGSNLYRAGAIANIFVPRRYYSGAINYAPYCNMVTTFSGGSVPTEPQISADLDGSFFTTDGNKTLRIKVTSYTDPGAYLKIVLRELVSL